MNPDWQFRYDEALLAVREAGKVALRYFDTDLVIETKADASHGMFAGGG